MKILALDSSAVSASAAVLDDDKVLGEFFINTKQTHSQTLMPMVQQVLIQTKTSLEEMDLFAVSAGPGSFTGDGGTGRAGRRRGALVPSGQFGEEPFAGAGGVFHSFAVTDQFLA